MESRNIALTLEKAKEWYNSGSAELKEVALQAFTKEELKTPMFTNIKIYGDARRALEARGTYGEVPFEISHAISNHSSFVTLLDVIREALNEGWKPNLIEGNVYYPRVRFYPADKAKEIVAKTGWRLGPSFISDGKKYTLVGGDYELYVLDGLSGFDLEYGSAIPNLGLLGCKSDEIAAHMSRYFMKEIFEATYAQYVGLYKWV